MKKILIILSMFLFAQFLFANNFLNQDFSKKDKKDNSKLTHNKSKDVRDALSKFAKSYEGKIIPKSDRWNKYSSGFIKMVFLNSNIDVSDVEKVKDEEGKRLTAIEVIYNFVEKNGSFKSSDPKIGDIVFFDNTYDANKDKEFNDKLTSIGLVVDIDKDNTVYFLQNTSKGVKLKMMNLKMPSESKLRVKNITKLVNSKMRWLKKEEKSREGSDKFPTLAGQMFNSFGSILDDDKLSKIIQKKSLSKKDRENLVKYAKSYEGKIIPKSNRWNKYSSGFIKMVFLNSMLNLYNLDNKKNEEGKWLSGIEIIHKYIEKNGKIKNSDPKIGDIVFFDNTYDANKDKEFNDKLTSIGLVVDVDKDNTVYFLQNTSKGVKLKMMNLKMPSESKLRVKNITKLVNSKMRWLKKEEKSREDSDKLPTLAGQMFNSFGSVFVN